MLAKGGDDGRHRRCAGSGKEGQGDCLRIKPDEIPSIDPQYISKAINLNNEALVKHRKNCNCYTLHSLFKGHNINVNIVVLACQK